MLSAAAEIDDDELLANSGVTRLINQICTNCRDQNGANKSNVMRTPHRFAQPRAVIEHNKTKPSECLRKERQKSGISVCSGCWEAALPGKGIVIWASDPLPVWRGIIKQLFRADCQG